MWNVSEAREGRERWEDKETDPAQPLLARTLQSLSLWYNRERLEHDEHRTHTYTKRQNGSSNQVVGKLLPQHKMGETWYFYLEREKKKVSSTV